MSLVEVLIASGLLLAIAIGIMPLLMRAVANNVRGWQATVVSNEARTELDQFLASPLTDNVNLAVPTGASELQRVQSWTLGDLGIENDEDEGWQDGAPTDKGPILYQRTITVRQYNLTDIYDLPIGYTGDAGFAHYVIQGSTLATSGRTGGTQDALIHLKQVEILNEGVQESGDMGGGQKLYVRLFKTY